MNIVVLMKQVPDTSLQVRASDEGTDIDRDGLEYIISPYDEYAIWKAVKLKEEKGGKAVLVSVGPERVQKSLRQGLAFGLDEAVLVDDSALEKADGPALARVLARVCQELEADLVLCGRESADEARAQVGAAVAELLGWPQATDVTDLAFVDDSRLTATVERQGGHAVLEIGLPAVCTAQKGLTETQYASLKGIMKAKKKPLARKSLADLGLDAAAVEPGVTVRRLAAPRVKEKSLRLFEGDDAASKAGAAVAALVDELKIV